MPPPASLFASASGDAPAAAQAQAPAGAVEASGGGGAAYDESKTRAGFEHALLAFWRSRGYPTVPPCSMNWLRLALVPRDLWSRVQVRSRGATRSRAAAQAAQLHPVLHSVRGVLTPPRRAAPTAALRRL